MTREMGASRHGMMKGVTAAIAMACEGEAKGTQSLDHRPAAEIGSAQGPRVQAQRNFGRLLDRQEEQPSVEEIRALANRMAETPETATDGPADAGMAFLGQFIDHDLTLDATTRLGVAAGRVEDVENFRTPRFDLDSVFGAGPEVDPWLYGQGGEARGLAFGRGWAAGSLGNPLDLQRNCNDRALIGDPRNDENLFVSQLHGRLFVARYNELLAEETGSDEERFEAARTRLRHEYQNRVLTEFLPAVVAPSVLDPMVSGARAGHLPGPVHWGCAPDMPVEFSAAAFRFGHSMIRQSYDLNDAHGTVDVFSPINRGFSPVKREHNLDFARYFGPAAQKSRSIDTRIVRALIELPPNVVSDHPNLAERNMLRGQHTFCLPTGEAAATALGLDVLDPSPDVEALKMTGRTPLWYYLLWEAEQFGGKLGPLGGTLVAGTILNLMLRDPGSILNLPAEASQAVARVA
ncbi:peroxidase family protein [uncultured Jannaschia sp.]|uniref:peroxidase family protein n=1 Tax=uncultured Jannaschia sp. TaxID=293347 RepID=UPI0026141EAA|nr:peroxidase family protein [uncultured Jannaschia sp.]